MSGEAMAGIAVAAIIAAICIVGLVWVFTKKVPPPIVKFDWRNDWSFEGSDLDKAEIDEVKLFTIETFRGAFARAGFGVVVSDGGSTNKIIVSPDLGPGTGETPGSPFEVNFSWVYYPVVRNQALSYARQLNVTNRHDKILALGRGLGAAAAHEFGHQKQFVFDNTRDPHSYDYYSGDRPQQYFEDLHWTPQAWAVMKGKLPGGN